MTKPYHVWTDYISDFQICETADLTTFRVDDRNRYFPGFPWPPKFSPEHVTHGISWHKNTFSLSDAEKREVQDPSENKSVWSLQNFESEIQKTERNINSQNVVHLILQILRPEWRIRRARPQRSLTTTLFPDFCWRSAPSFFRLPLFPQFRPPRFTVYYCKPAETRLFTFAALWNKAWISSDCQHPPQLGCSNAVRAEGDGFTAQPTWKTHRVGIL